MFVSFMCTHCSTQLNFDLWFDSTEFAFRFHLDLIVQNGNTKEKDKFVNQNCHTGQNKKKQKK